MEEIDFGFFFCRVAHFYSYTDEYLLGRTMKRFWLAHECIDRISAQKDMRALTVSAVAQSGEAASEYRKKLIVEIGTLAKVSDTVLMQESAQRDEEGFSALKFMEGQTIGSRV